MFPGNGGSSLIVVSISVDTISKRTDCPSTVLRKLNLGRSEFVELILYCSDAIPSIVAFLIGFPKLSNYSCLSQILFYDPVSFVSVLHDQLPVQLELLSRD